MWKWCLNSPMGRGLRRQSFHRATFTDRLLFSVTSLQLNATALLWLSRNQDIMIDCFQPASAQFWSPIKTLSSIWYLNGIYLIFCWVGCTHQQQWVMYTGERKLWFHTPPPVRFMNEAWMATSVWAVLVQVDKGMARWYVWYQARPSVYHAFVWRAARESGGSFLFQSRDHS